MMFDVASALKAQQWERAKGELRALVNMQGSYHTGGQGPEADRFEELNTIVEAFIKDVEGAGLHE